MGGKYIKISKDTYGLFLISNNCFSILESDIQGSFKERLKKIGFINFWTLFGVHDTAMLVRSPGRLDRAVDEIGDWIAGINDSNILIKSHIFAKDARICKIPDNIKNLLNGEYKNLFDISIANDKSHNKKFKIYEYRVDPLIPIYIRRRIMESNAGIFLIIYIKFDVHAVRKMLEEKKGNLEDFYKPFINQDTAGVFQGFGLFDIIIIERKSNYKFVRDAIIDIRKKSKLIISETYSLISENNSLQHLGYDTLDCTILIKVSAGAEDSKIWNQIKKLALDMGLEGLCIRKPESKSVCCPPNTSFRAGYFDLAIDIGFKRIQDLQNFITILDCMPFIEDTSTTISYDTNNDIDCPIIQEGKCGDIHDQPRI